jgi:CheY-like chemotaxis protein
MSAEKNVLSVGQCSADHGSISYTLREHFAARVVRADSADEALRLLEKTRFDLVLVNRVFDADGASGLEFLRAVRSQAAAPPVMLVSNFADAQREAVEAGAAAGFGKAMLGRPEMLASVRPFLA